MWWGKWRKFWAGLGAVIEALTFQQFGAIQKGVPDELASNHQIDFLGGFGDTEIHQMRVTLTPWACA